MQILNNHRGNIKTGKTQSGIALLTALLVVALATIIAVNITERQQYDIRKMENILYNQQAYQIALGGEYWARGLLLRDHLDDKRGNGTDNLFEDWAQPLPTTVIEGGSISGQVIDQQGLFNLNNLHITDPDDQAEKNRLKEQRQYFERLLRILEIDQPITDAIIDWLDSDVEAKTPNGAEDQVYLEKQPAYRTANQRMHNPSELLLINGINHEIYEKLRPFVTALPEHTTINVNTAPAEIVAALSSQLNLDKSTSIIDDRTSAYDSIKAFLDNTKGLAQDQQKYELEITPLIGVSSQYFQVQARVSIDKISTRLTSTLKSNVDGTIEAIARDPGLD